MEDRIRCEIEECNNLALSRGDGKFHKLCTRHHRKKYGMPQSLGSRIRKDTIDRIENKKCINCGWEGPCDRHRINPGQNGGKYEVGNIVVLCPNCHRLLHLNKLEIR